jgi:hypothetical protein
VSYPYPQDRHRDRKEKGEQPYKDAKEAMAQQAEQIQAGAEAFGEARSAETEEARRAALAEELESRVQDVTREVRADETDAGGPEGRG